MTDLNVEQLQDHKGNVAARSMVQFTSYFEHSLLQVVPQQFVDYMVRFQSDQPLESENLTEASEVREIEMIEL